MKTKVGTRLLWLRYTPKIMERYFIRPSCIPVLVLMACTAGAPEDTGTRWTPPVVFGFPLLEPERFPVLVGVDHDPIQQDDTLLGAATCTDYMGRGFPNCYDQHHGNDYILDGDFSVMDTQPAAVLAAADGIIISVVDGHYDKCHPGPDFNITCDGNPIIANHVQIEHADGIVSKYWHLRKDSVRVAVGEAVSCGQILGEVGSSGNSSKPHLHFEVEDPEGHLLNPYAGPYSQEVSWWHTQNAPDVLPGPGCTVR